MRDIMYTSMSMQQDNYRKKVLLISESTQIMGCKTVKGEKAHPGNLKQFRVGRGGHDRAVVVRDLPGASLSTPHVGEASTNRDTVPIVTELKDVHARVQVGLAAIVHLHAVVGDGAERVLLDEVLEVVLGEVAALDVLGRYCWQEGETRGRVQIRYSLGVLSLKGVVPLLEVPLRVCTTDTLSETKASRKPNAAAKTGAGRAHPGNFTHLMLRQRGLRRCGDGGGGGSSNGGRTYANRTLTAKTSETTAARKLITNMQQTNIPVFIWFCRTMPRAMRPGAATIKESMSIEIACLDTAPGRVCTRAPARSPSGVAGRRAGVNAAAEPTQHANIRAALVRTGCSIVTGASLQTLQRHLLYLSDHRDGDVTG